MNEILMLAIGLLIGFMPFLIVYTKETQSIKELKKAARKKKVAYIFHDFRGNMFIKTADIMKGSVNVLDVENEYGTKLLTRDHTDVEFIDGEIKCIHYLVDSVYSLSTPAARAYCSIQEIFKTHDLEPTAERIIFLMELDWSHKDDEFLHEAVLNELGCIGTSLEQFGILRQIWESAQEKKLEGGPIVYSSAKDYLHAGGQNTSVAFSAYKASLKEMLDTGKSFGKSLFGSFDMKTILIIIAVIGGAFFLMQSGILESLGGIL